MKIIRIDNFDRESVSDVLVAKGLTKYYAELIVKLLNDKSSGDYAPNFYRAVEDTYKLYVFEP